MSMNGVIRSLKTLCENEVRDAAGIVEEVYVGVSDDQRQIIINDYPYLIIDDGGEVTIETGVNAMQVKNYQVIFELGIRGLDIEPALLDLLDRWERFEEIIFHPDNRRIEYNGEMVAEAIDSFSNVEVGYMTAGDNEARPWRYRRATIPYRLGICRGGYHPFR
jgi:hypothetical protein